MQDDDDFTLGIEEEYLLVDAETGALAEAPDALMAACKADLGDQVSPEYLRCQIEVGTPVSRNIAEARDHLARLRLSIATHAAEFGMAPISVACHPFADWRDQSHTDKDRYIQLSREMGAVSRRMLICGMHVHVGITDKALRIELMNQMPYFLPHLLALSVSSPFWQGVDTGLGSYRTTVFGNYPRTGLPPQFAGWGEYQRSVQALVHLGIIQDASKIWWDLRPSSHYPTLETRICDACPRIRDALTMAATIQATARMLVRLHRKNLRWRQYDNFLLGENRWRALRYGVTEGLIDFGSREIRPFAQLTEDWLALIAEDADALDSQPATARLRDMAQDSAADRQRAVMASALAAGADHDQAMRAVVQHLIAEFRRDL
ncbi:carboxylate-amine ligase [Paracoccus shanxieyensis]|uniref:Putative glutamate--cysteine ligase 2 n=1 Tax=Paracoccus shanxieyensis TaxID=2675752 RepID=A0A6L6IY41_9RHOB|nr:carboxylate-amine ligase [Paracoccus shanxieyensis]MTH64202.1 carboxylate-amine ligase [Paracoccus shanxieyensis]MTH87346.1 carboxylate-amine ligase [Paracoccus shanxieyensis]